MPDEGYIEPEIVTDAEDLAARIYAYIEAAVPGWTPAPGNLETILAEAFSSVAADTRDMAVQVPPAIFRTFGAELVGIAPEDAAAATATSTWTMIDTSGYTIPAGTQVEIAGPAGGVAFVTVDDVVVPPGSATTSAGEVVLEAVEEGADANGLSSTPSLIDTLAYVDSIALVGSTSGGVTAETTDDYLDRLSRELRLMTPRPILPADFAVLARRVDGVERAVAIDGLDPTGPTEDNERTVAVAVIDENGNTVSAGVKDDVEELLEAMREVNFVVHVMDPTYTTVDVETTVVALDGYDLGDLQTAIEAAIVEYLDPGNWGRPNYREQDSDPEWTNATVVRLFEVAEVINRVDGVDYVDDLTLNGTSADVTLSGYVALPTLDPATPTVTVNAP